MVRRQILKGFPPYMEMFSIINKVGPTFMALNMKPICNFKCTKCFVGEQKALTGIHDFLTLDEMKIIVNNAKKSGVKVLAISGSGEPFVDENIYEVVKFANKNRLITIMATNASVLNREIINFLRDNNVTFTISLDTTDPGRFAKKTGTTKKMFYKVYENLMLAEEIYKGTKISKEIKGEIVDIYRLAIHMTLQNEEFAEIQKVKRLATEDTLFSLSPMANYVGFAKDANLDSEVSKVFKEEISEKHIVCCYDEENNLDICGNFRFGIDINFDGQLLLDAHAVDTRKLFKNIRDFDYNISEAFTYLYEIKKEFIKNWLDGFCPIRSKKFADWVNKKKSNSYF